MIISPRTTRAGRRSGITLTEILISIMILGVGMVSLATLFPLGLLKLRDATRYSRTAYLVQSAASDMASRGLLNKQTFFSADMLNGVGGYPYWYYYVSPNPVVPTPYAQYDPFVQDTPSYGGAPYALNPNGTVSAYYGAVANLGSGLPVAYDPLWRYRTGVYLDPLNQTMPEARFASGSNYVRAVDPTDGNPPSAYGLQRLTNFNRPMSGALNLMNAANNIPAIFVSPEDVVWNEEQTTTNLSPVIPDLAIASSPNTTANDWRYSWMFTGLQTNTPPASGLPTTSLGATFDGNLVIWENRPFGIEAVAGGSGYQVDGETVVEAVFGYSTNVSGPPGYGLSSDRSVLLRWPATQTDIVVKAGDWIADVTYERNYLIASTRFVGVPNPAHQGEWDNMPPQRCYWYQVQRSTPPTNDLSVAGMRSMVVSVGSSLQAKTLMTASGQWQINAALIARNVINVIPQTFFVR